METAPADLPTSAASANVLYETRDAVALVTLNRPAKRNALNGALLAELRAALERAAQTESVRAILLTGAGKDFCAGLDLSELEKIAQADAWANWQDAQVLGDLLLQMRRLPKPIIAAVQGRAFAGGAGIATACDLVIAAETAQFCYTETRLGFVPALVMALARRNVSEKRAFEWLTLAQPFSAIEAERSGLINRVCAPEALTQTSETLANELASISASAIALTKTLLYQTEAQTFAQALQAGAQVNALARLTTDCQQGVRNFLAKQASTRKA